jgi:hypothetical protein
MSDAADRMNARARWLDHRMGQHTRDEGLPFCVCAKALIRPTQERCPVCGRVDVDRGDATPLPVWPSPLRINRPSGASAPPDEMPQGDGGPDNDEFSSSSLSLEAFRSSLHTVDLSFSGRPWNDSPPAREAHARTSDAPKRANPEARDKPAVVQVDQVDPDV